jgi:hypothetical protein
MINRVLIDRLNFNARNLAIRWKDNIRKASHLKHYNALNDDDLIHDNDRFYALLARTLDRGLDRSLVGNFFVTLGKERMRAGFPISEIIYAVNLVEQTVIEYIMSDLEVDSSAALYSIKEVIIAITSFFVLGCFYVTKGFLEETYTSMNQRDAVSEQLLKKYFKDDFFFKKG